MRKTAWPVLAVVLAGVLTSGAAHAGGRTNLLCRNDTGDDERINAATAASAPGDEIVLTGTCLVDGTVRLASDRTYRGVSRSGTVVRQAPGANLDAMLASDSYLDDVPWTGGPVTLRSLTLLAERDTNPHAHDALVLRSWQAVVEDVVVLGAARHGVRVTNLSANGTPLTNTQVNGRIVGNHIAGSGARGVHVEDTGNSVTDWQLLDNWVEDSGTDGIGLDNAAGWLVRGNHVYGVGGVALWAQRLFGSSVTDNYLEDFGTSGIRVSVQGEAASVVSGNRVFKANGGSGTFLEVTVNYGVGNLVVTGNAVRGNGSGVGLDFRGPRLVVASTGNLVTGVAVPRRVGAGVSLSAGI
ncbi:right-handed parallel beta-helix repeat-containing protein [Saccharothrix obliqua]|uniref:right-handed parallel beta-helix repeat-containing protein n=1 Tax=Saccharothrix obliqua TaxID=2861747 RepID=UPI001C5D57D0|nr:right-handed parallel beta-helix repeat-containing protein [Saccharothrix obliqua]MBW4721310.1 right-handed parallel beta-helix repeat-containing protein [Saccharothrix obliqua]